jgi:hypothetical protein
MKGDLFEDRKTHGRLCSACVGLRNKL